MPFIVSINSFFARSKYTSFIISEVFIVNFAGPIFKVTSVFVTVYLPPNVIHKDSATRDIFITAVI